MALHGPPPQPTRLRLLAGNPGKRPINRREPQPTGSPRKPDFVDREDWDRVICSMPDGVYTAADTPALAVFCSALALHRAALAEVQRDGLIGKGAEGHPVAHPLVAVVSRQAEIILRASDRLGLSPSARSRLEMPERTGKFDGLFGVDT